MPMNETMVIRYTSDMTVSLLRSPTIEQKAGYY